MGLNDRDYIRVPPPGSRRGFAHRAGGLSAVHWLIIVNVAVFIINALLAAKGMGFAVHMGDRFIDGYDPTQSKLIVQSAPEGMLPGTRIELAIIDPVSRALVGRRTIEWMAPLQAAGHFSTGKGFFALEVWRFVTFQFLHADISHLFLNMLGMWFFGPMVEQSLRSRKRFIAYYLTCGIFGAVLYLLLNTLGSVFGLRLPGLLFVDIYTPLIGASAGVFGVLMAAAKIAGDEEMLFMMVLPIKIRTGAYLLALGSLIALLWGTQNAGGEAAHVGGAIAGYFFIRRMDLLHDFFDIFGHSGRKNGKRKAARSSVSTEKIDAILDKVRASGMHSLTQAERDTLSRATAEQQGKSR